MTFSRTRSGFYSRKCLPLSVGCCIRLSLLVGFVCISPGLTLAAFNRKTETKTTPSAAHAVALDKRSRDAGTNPQALLVDGMPLIEDLSPAAASAPSEASLTSLDNLKQLPAQKLVGPSEVTGTAQTTVEALRAPSKSASPPAALSRPVTATSQKPAPASPNLETTPVKAEKSLTPITELNPVSPAETRSAALPSTVKAPAVPVPATTPTKPSAANLATPATTTTPTTGPNALLMKAEASVTAESALHQLSHQIANEAGDRQPDIAKDMALLWQSAVERSGTIRYAIEKLSRRDATGKPIQASFNQRLLQSVVHLGGVAGTLVTQNPAGMMGGSILQDALKADPTQAGQLISDADMVILAKAVETLQYDLMAHYMDYCRQEAVWQVGKNAVRALTIQARRAENNPDAALYVDLLVQTAAQDEQRLKQEFISARNALSLLVGSDALVALETLRNQDKTGRALSSSK
jgi:hypothetical protein